MADNEAMVSGPDRRGEEAEQPLFRSEVMAARQSQWLGNVLLEPRISQTFAAGFAVLAAAAIIALFFFGTFTRKAKIEGVLVPEQGLVRIYAPRPGVVTGIHVQEGVSVRKGQPLITLSGETQSEALGATV